MSTLTGLAASYVSLTSWPDTGEGGPGLVPVRLLSHFLPPPTWLSQKGPDLITSYTCLQVGGVYLFLMLGGRFLAPLTWTQSPASLPSDMCPRGMHPCFPR